MEPGALMAIDRPRVRAKRPFGSLLLLPTCSREQQTIERSTYARGHSCPVLRKIETEERQHVSHERGAG